MKALAPKEIAEILDISTQLARGLINAGTIKSVQVGKRKKVLETDLKKYLDENRYEPVRVFIPKKRGRPAIQA